MSSAPPSLLPTQTLPGERARGERLAAQHFHLVLLDTGRAGTLYPLGSEVPREPTAGPPGERRPVASSGPFKVRGDERVRAFEREYLTRLLHRPQGNIARAAREAGLDRKHLDSLLHKYGLVQTEEG